MKTLDLQRWKKTSTSPFTYCWKWFQNWIPFIHTSDSQIQQLQAFFWKSTDLKCDCKLIKIPSLFLENSFANVLNSTLYVKVVFSKLGLAVSVPKNANISGTILAMKIPKLGLSKKIGTFLSHKNLGQHLLTKSAEISN